MSRHGQQLNALSQPPIFPHLSNQFVIQLMAFNGGFIDSGVFYFALYYALKALRFRRLLNNLFTSYLFTAGYLKLRGLFVSSITGNLVVMAASVSTDRGLLARSLIVASFALGCFALKQLMEALRILNMSFHFQLLIGHSSIFLLVSLVTIFGIFYNDLIDDASIDDWIIILPACLLAISMGYQNTVCEASFRDAPPTTVMTMTLVRGANALSTALSQYVILAELRKENRRLAHNYRSEDDRRFHNDVASLTLAPNVQQEAQQELSTDIEIHAHLMCDYLRKFITISRPLTLFMIGSVIGAKLMEVIDFYCMLMPLCVMLAVVVELALALIFRGADFLREDFQTRPTSLSGAIVSVPERLQEQLEAEKALRRLQLQQQQVALSASGINRLDSFRSVIDEDVS